MMRQTITMDFLVANLHTADLVQAMQWTDLYRANSKKLDLDADVAQRDRVFEALVQFIDPKDPEPFNAMLELLKGLVDGPVEVDVYEVTRPLVLDIPVKELVKMKQYLEMTGHTKYIVYDAAPFYRYMLMCKILNPNHEMDWSDTLDMNDFVKEGACVKIGPRTEPGLWQHPDYNGLTENGTKLLVEIRRDLKQSQEIFGEPTNLSDISLLAVNARGRYGIPISPTKTS